MRDDSGGNHIIVAIAFATMNIGIISIKIKDANRTVLLIMTRSVGQIELTVVVRDGVT